MTAVDLLELLGRPGTLVVAFEPSGGRAVPVPDSLRDVPAEPLDVDSPLDALDPASQGRAVVAYEHARRHGRGAAPVQLADDETPRRLEIFDLDADHGCYLAVLLLDDADADEAEAASVLAPLRATYELNVSGVVQAISPEFTAMLGWGEDEVVGRSSLDLIHPDDHERGVLAWGELLERPTNATRLRQRFKTVGGDWLWCEVTDHNRLDGDEPRVEGELVDISREMAAHAALERRERLLDRLSQALPTGVLYVDAGGATIVGNERWAELTGLALAQGIDPLVDDVTEAVEVRQALDDALDRGIDADIEVSFSPALGACAHGILHLRPLLEPGRPVELLVTLEDLTDQRRYQDELAAQSRRDPLTGIANRLGIEEALTSQLDPANPAGGGVAVLFIDLDRFKSINDTHGHAVGDEVLTRVAARLRDLVRTVDTVGRLGGDEYLIVLGDQPSPDHATELAARVGEAVQAVADEVVPDLAVGASVGVAIAHPDDDFDSLLIRADEAMYRAKAARNRAPAGDPTPS